MKKTKIIYWIFTGLFAALMLFSAVPDAMVSADAVQFMTFLGYPKYFIPFIGAAKIIGVIAILLPVPPRLKEWAYAGLAFDLIGAIYSAIAATLAAGMKLDPKMALMLIWVVPGIVSYVYYHKMIRGVSVNKYKTVAAGILADHV